MYFTKQIILKNILLNWTYLSPFIIFNSQLGKLTVSMSSKHLNFLTMTPENLLFRSPLKQYINSTFFLLLKGLYNCVYGFFLEIKIKGIGYKYRLRKKNFSIQNIKLKIKKRKNFLILKLGYRKRLAIYIPKAILLKINRKKKSLFVFGLNVSLVKDFIYKLFLLKPFNPYTGKGFRLAKVRMKLKVGKQR